MRNTARYSLAIALVLFASQAAAPATNPVPLFLNLPRYSAGTTLQYFLQADVNEDGKSDIVGLAGGVTVMLGNGVGGFGASKNTSIAGFDSVVSTSLAIADFNEDGRPDVAFLGLYHVTGSLALAVMLGNGDGSFQSPLVTILGGANATSVALGDFNGDGKEDIAVGASPNGNGQVLVLLGNGSGLFSAPITTNVNPNAGINCIAAGDFNNDGKIDVVVQQNASGLRTFGFVLLGEGNGSFQTPIALDNGANCDVSISVADLNHDGNEDLVMGGDEGSIEVLLGDGTGKFRLTASLGVCANGQVSQCTIVLGDFNGDGFADIAALDRVAYTITIAVNQDSGSFPELETYNADGVSSGVGLVSMVLNGGTKQDLVFANNVQGVSVLVGNGDGTFQGNFAQSVTPSGTDLRVYDFNGDHKPDLITVPSSAVLLNNGNDTFTIRPLTDERCSDLGSFAIGDFNGDGKADIVGAAGPQGSPGSMTICLGNGDGTFTFLATFEQGIEHEFVLPGDFNNDGKLDLAVSDEGGISIFLGNGDGTFQTEVPTALSAKFPATALGDFNNDGKLDIAAITPSGIAVLLGNGNGTFKSPLISSGPTTGLLTAVDLNKDGKLDLVSSGISVLLGKGNGTFLAPVHYAGGSTRPIVADFNGDGHLDVAVGSTTSISLLLGDGTGKLGTPTAYHAAPITGIASGDFNGDKATDIAVALHPAGANVLTTLLNQK